MLKIQSDRVIIDGHEPTKEQCETMTLLANALAESDKFKTVKYESGYAEFEKVGKADELKFISAIGNLRIYDASGQNVYTQMVYNGDRDMNVSLQGTKITFFGSNGHAFYPSEDATINSANINISYDGTSWGTVTKYEITLPYAPKKIRYFGGYDGEFADAAGSNYVDIIINNGETITLSSENYSSAGGGAIQYYEEATSKVSVDLTTLPGWSSLSSGSHNITIVAKADGYRDSEPSAAVSVEKAAEEGYKVTFKKGDYSEADYYSTDNGVTWISCHDKFGTGVQFIVMAKQIKLKVQGDGSIAGQMSAKIDSTGANILSLLISCTSTDSDISSNYILTENITVTASGYWD